MLLTWSPVPGTTIPEPSPLVHVTAHAQPASSITEMCVVEPSRLLMNDSRNPGSASPSRKAGVRSDCARSIARASSTELGPPAPRCSSSSSASA